MFEPAANAAVAVKLCSSDYPVVDSEDLRVLPARAQVPLAIFGIGGAVLLVLLAVAPAYGFHRDELYFVLAGRHPDWGYVDQPPLTPLLSGLSVGLFGLSPLAVRTAPAIAAAAVIVLTAAIARQLGASRAGQVLAALVLAVSGWLGAGHLDVTVTYDVLGWTVALWLLVPMLEDRDGLPARRWRWLALGVVVGLALENKTLAITLPITIAAAVLMVRRFDLVRKRGPWLAALVALLIWAPNLVWQAAHGFPQVTMAESITANQGPGLDGRINAIEQLLAISGPLLFPVAIAGVAWLVRSPLARAWRPLGLAILLQLGLMLAVNGKSYYSAGYLPLAIAAGTMPLESWLRRGRRGLRRTTFAAATLLSGLAVAVLTLPIVPVDALDATPIPSLYEEAVSQVGWPQLAEQVEAVVATLPVSQRATAVIVTADYGQYSALTLLGTGLPPVYSGHNSTFDWGRPPDGAGPVVLVAFDPVGETTLFDGCRLAATIDNGLNLPTQEQGQAISICNAPVRPWSELWPELRHVD